MSTWGENKARELNLDFLQRKAKDVQLLSDNDPDNARLEELADEAWAAYADALLEVPESLVPNKLAGLVDLEFHTGGDVNGDQWDGWIIAVSEGKRVGTLHWRKWRGEYDVSYVEVPKEYRRHGVATALYRKLFESEGLTLDDLKTVSGLTPEGAALRASMEARRVKPNSKGPLEQAAEKILLLGKELFPRGTVKDAVVWDNGKRFAWVMDPIRMQRIGVSSDPDSRLPFQGGYVAHALKRLRMKGGPAFEYEREMVVYDFLGRMVNVLGDLVDTSDTWMTLIPEPGYPWPTDRYYSAQKGRWVVPQRPEWLLPENVKEESRGIDSPGVDLCKLFRDAPSGFEMEALTARYGSASDDFFMVTHAMGSIENMTRFGDWETNAARVDECGGLLFPSMAIGPFPATNFGVCILVADVGLILSSLKPYLKRTFGRPLADVFDTDVWTGGTSTFMTDGALHAFDQLHGHSDYLSYWDLNIWTMGPPDSPGPAMGTKLDKVTQLKRELKQRFKLWSRKLMGSVEAVKTLQAQVTDSKSRYGYLEAKISALLPISSFPLAVAPKQAEPGFRTFLKKTGFRGKLVVVDLPHEVAEAMLFYGDDFDTAHAIQTTAFLQYGWEVADQVRKYGRELVL